MADGIPLPGRPHVPGYGVPKSEEGMLGWSFVTRRLAAASVYWVATTGPADLPHAVPYWGAWVDDTLYFETAPTTRGGRNLAANPAVAVHLGSGGEVVIIEGRARPAGADGILLARLQDAYRPKYDGYCPESGDNLHALEPVVAFAWDLARFPESMTRWRFAPPPHGPSGGLGP